MLQSLPTRPAAAILAALLGCAACGPSSTDAESLRPAEVLRIHVEERTGAPVLLLRERPGSRVLPIWIGPAEARAIAAALAGEEPPRPQTHDLARSLVEALGARIERVAVTDLREGTFLAEIHLRRGDDRFVVDARPSDAVALALRVRAPILVRSRLFDEAGGSVDEDGGEGRRERGRRPESEVET